MNTYSFPGQVGFYKGKVRDVYFINEDLLIMEASNRISAFDVILPAAIPFKGQVLNQIAAYMLNKTRDIVPNWFLESPAPTISIGKKCIPFKIEMVVRGTLTGHAWRTYSTGARMLCGSPMPHGLKEHDFFPTPIITPSTKAQAGHDEDIAPNEIIEQGLATQQEWEQLSQYALALFERGKEIALNRGLILADTKYEFGKIEDTIYLMDEVHTPDSSRYFFAEGYEKRQHAGEAQPQLSKEFVREWLISNNFMGKEGQQVPTMTTQWIEEISARYIELYEKVIGEKFVPQSLTKQEGYQLTLAALQKYS